MRDEGELRALLRRLDGRGYKAYKEIRGAYALTGGVLHVDHVQGDPYAAPSRVRVMVPQDVAGFPAESFATRQARNALTSLLAIKLGQEAQRREGKKGSGKSGLIQIDMPGQEILERTAVLVDEEGVEGRFAVGLPAAGRRILGDQAARLLCDELPHMVSAVLRYDRHDPAEITAYVHASEDAEAARTMLQGRGLIAFVADGSVLPRRSGVDFRPLPPRYAVPFSSPVSLRVTLDLPHRGPTPGMGIPRGVTLIVGGGFHGKSTLLEALELGVYNHRPGDGRELVVSDSSAVKIRAEAGRRVCGVDISPFIGVLPDGQDTLNFTTDNASGSTSQAANIMEALEVNVRVLLIDEDTAATNFMIRDHRMQELVAPDEEPITPLLDRVRQLHEDLGVSTILVVGGSGDYFDVADTVLAMQAYQLRDVTAEAREIAARFPTQRQQETAGCFTVSGHRVPQARSVDPRRGRRPVSVKARGTRTVSFGHEDIDLSAVEQLVEPSQARALAAGLAYARRRYMDEPLTVPELVRRVAADMDAQGLDVLDDRRVGDHARFRCQELAAALNRLRSLQVDHVRTGNGSTGERNQ